MHGVAFPECVDEKCKCMSFVPYRTAFTQVFSYKYRTQTEKFVEML